MDTDFHGQPKHSSYTTRKLTATGNPARACEVNQCGGVEVLLYRELISTESVVSLLFKGSAQGVRCQCKLGCRFLGILSAIYLVV